MCKWFNLQIINTSFTKSWFVSQVLNQGFSILSWQAIKPQRVQKKKKKKKKKTGAWGQVKIIFLHLSIYFELSEG